MDQRNSRRGGHSAPARRQASTRGRHTDAPPQRRRREPLRDNYYYEEPPRHRGGGPAPQSFEDISSYSSSGRRRADQRSTRRVKKRKGNKGAVKALLLLFVLLILAGGVYVFGYMLSGLTMTHLTSDKAALGIDGNAHTEPGIKNIALFGLDAREDENVGRSDALMVLSVDSKHHKLKLTSILRDSQVYIDGYGYDKVTHAYAYGGPELAIKALNQNFHLDIQDYVTVNFMEMARIVDAFGGVRLHVTPEEMEELNNNITNFALESPEAGIVNSDYLFAPGDVLLNGHQAVAYARIRYLEGGDDMRASRQQLVLQALIQQLKGKSKLSYPALVHDVVPLCETSLDYLGMMGLAPFLLTDFSMETLTIPGEEEGAYGDYTEAGAWVYVYDTEGAAGHIRRFIYE